MKGKQIAYLQKLGINIENVGEKKLLLFLKNKRSRVAKPRRYIERLKNKSFIYLIAVYENLLRADLRPIYVDVPLLFTIVKKELHFSDKQTYEYVWALLAIDALMPVSFPMEIFEEIFKKKA